MQALLNTAETWIVCLHSLISVDSEFRIMHAFTINFTPKSYEATPLQWSFLQACALSTPIVCAAISPYHPQPHFQIKKHSLARPRNWSTEPFGYCVIIVVPWHLVRHPSAKKNWWWVFQILHMHQPVGSMSWNHCVCATAYMKKVRCTPRPIGRQGVHTSSAQLHRQCSPKIPWSSVGRNLYEGLLFSIQIRF